MLKIVTVPNKILNLPVKPVTNFDNRFKNLVKEMEKTLIAQKDPIGVGLAAPQIGISQALFIIKPMVKGKTMAFVNPKIVKISYNQSPTLRSGSVKSAKTKKTKLEGCLSIPRIWGPVRRNNKVLLEYQTVEGVKKQEWFSGFEAIIIEHEVDHLQGILFTQRALEQKTPIYEEKNGKLKPVEIG